MLLACVVGAAAVGQRETVSLDLGWRTAPARQPACVYPVHIAGCVVGSAHPCRSALVAVGILSSQSYGNQFAPLKIAWYGCSRMVDDVELTRAPLDLGLWRLKQVHDKAFRGSRLLQVPWKQWVASAEHPNSEH
jgi:hypothetical protein